MNLQINIKERSLMGITIGRSIGKQVAVLNALRHEGFVVTGDLPGEGLGGSATLFAQRQAKGPGDFDYGVSILCSEDGTVTQARLFFGLATGSLSTKESAAVRIRDALLSQLGAPRASLDRIAQWGNASELVSSPQAAYAALWLDDGAAETTVVDDIGGFNSVLNQVSGTGAVATIEGRAGAVVADVQMVQPDAQHLKSVVQIANLAAMA